MDEKLRKFELGNYVRSEADLRALADAAAENEREAVVQWLRGEASALRRQKSRYGFINDDRQLLAGVLAGYAEAIERGDHLASKEGD